MLMRQEDPYIWRNKYGWHILTHHFNVSSHLKTYTAQHLYSPDLEHWSAGPIAPYNTTVDFGATLPIGFDTSVVTFDRRERPALVLDAEGNPEMLVSGVEKERSGKPGHSNTSCLSLTLGTPLKSDDDGPLPLDCKLSPHAASRNDHCRSYLDSTSQDI